MEYTAILKAQKDFFYAQKTKSVSSRIKALCTFKEMLISYEHKIYKALFADFNKTEHEAYLTEWAILIKDIELAQRSLKKWTKRKRVGTNLLNWPGQSFSIAEPYGQSLIIGTWNYPIQLTLAPAIAALAAGNTIILKPSELALNTSQCIADMIKEFFNPELITVIQGGVKETTDLLKLKFDKIFFTGSTAVGKIVYQAAAKNLTPVTLELGGKSPAVISQSAQLPKAIKRLVWAKYLNAGQTCIAPDYVFVHQKIYEQALSLFNYELNKNKYAIEANNYVQIINDRHLNRLEKLIDQNNIYHGGDVNRSTRTISPTLLTEVHLDDEIMQEEIFGPLLPIISYTEYKEVITYIQSKEKPLAAYLFSKDRREINQWLSELSFGGGCINDAIMHIINPKLPFGGVGLSGMGSYHGKAGFDTFSHYKSIFRKPSSFEVPLKYPPYSKKKMTWIKRLIRFS